MKTILKQVKEAAITLMKNQPITKVHGRPTRQNYIVWKKELERAANQIEIEDTYPWTVDATGNNYGGMKLTMDDNEYQIRTGINTFVEPVEPVHYNPNINEDTPHSNASKWSKNMNRQRTTIGRGKERRRD